ncbi:hypothetical protein PUNSTDRAFT_74635 [Punctularia strigosozonata HHB-11173 SS5]|uniref:uncharacterized protein n=1 Tax=Punctularia strigosozonata (strain HHB-11173) TaxID=741275 RepID=UPI00044174F4|nr:uncharacterized protein PUNSTDRAFT_74635 [Punctularia strigosozonata HHB-11173 SS5]EIN05517.1 hypothetical protein PUNSTDRAFT_74635 [Punctularia strigosozonata HHB-11173 SS5]
MNSTHQPSHPGLFRVCFVPGEYRSYLQSEKNLKPGDVVTYLRGLTKGAKAYSSVQCGPGPEDHVELNSDLLYMNHSCDPSVVVDLSSKDPSLWQIRAIKHINAGDPLTFFYPSTEWVMAQPFECNCGSPNCLGRVEGAFSLSKAQLKDRGFINPWIWDLKLSNA